MQVLRFISLCLFSQVACAAPPQYPLEYFAKLPQYAAPMVSPDGRKIAATININGAPMIYIKNRDAPDQVYPPIQTGGSFINGYGWPNNERLIISLRGTTKFSKYIFNYSRLVSTRFDGKDPIGYKMEPNRWGFFRQNAHVIGKSEADDNHVLMTLDENPEEWNTPLVHSVDVNTGKKELVQGNNHHMQGWLADTKGRVRIGFYTETTGNNPETKIMYREKEGDAWQELQNVSYFDKDRLQPFGFDRHDDNILLVTTDNLNDKDENNYFPEEMQLYRYNLTTRKIDGEYVDPARKGAIATAAKALPGRKISLLSSDKDGKVFTLAAYSDDKSPQYFLLDRNSKTLDFIGSPYPALEQATLAKMQTAEYKARDGHTIPAYLTLPQGSSGKNLPFIIYVHGGPWARDYWGFDNYVQFFANRGYGVLQPEYRGSTGFGLAHQEAGYGQWGRLIQDDISDGVKYLVSQGIADPKRICIVGGSYGGYAAAAGLAKTPELYRCGISINGVMDLERHYDNLRNYYFKNINRAIFNDPNHLKQDSPLHLAAAITAPLLLIGSEKDTVVPVVHSLDMRAKLEKLHKPVTYVELKNGEHWRTVDANELTTFQAIEKFLAANLGA